ncbi:MAG: hypothetical protein LBP30_03730 [Clostridiales Family XIII bacterium]|jgi:hypothetical protein|nr:hypothetical protein [Clostridiales Family XIII bacterium]
MMFAIFAALMALPVFVAYLIKDATTAYLMTMFLVPVWYAVAGSIFAIKENLPVIAVTLISFIGNMVYINMPDGWDNFVDLFFKGEVNDSTFALKWILIITNGIMLLIYLILLHLGLGARTEDEWLDFVKTKEMQGLKIGMTFEEWKASKRSGA